MDDDENSEEAKSFADAVPQPKRGRPSAQWFTAVEIATFLDVEAERVERSLELEKFRKSFWPHAERRGLDGAWMIPERDLVKLLGPSIPKPLWVSEFAEFIGYSVAQVGVWIREGVIPTVTIFGRRRVLATELWKLPKHRPAAIKRKCPRIDRRKAA